MNTISVEIERYAVDDKMCLKATTDLGDDFFWSF